jgi:hypothetical protein
LLSVIATIDVANRFKPGARPVHGSAFEVVK